MDDLKLISLTYSLTCVALGVGLSLRSFHALVLETEKVRLSTADELAVLSDDGKQMTATVTSHRRDERNTTIQALCH